MADFSSRLDSLSALADHPSREVGAIYPPLPSGKHHFLVVDDEPDVLDSIRRLFRKDYEVFLALSAAEAFEVLDREVIHLVMSDQRMPELSGVEFLAEVKRRYPHVVRMLFTGYGDVQVVVEAINQGDVYRYINKPFDPAELKVMVAQAAEHYNMLAERDRLLGELSRQNRALESRNRDLADAYNELRVLDRLKTVFMEVVSHELNTPTAIILGYASLLQRAAVRENEAAARQAVAGIHSSGLRLKGIADKIIKMMTADVPELRLDMRPVDAVALVRDIVAELQPVLETRSQRAIVECPVEPLTLDAEEAYLRDLLMNLLVNAVKFSPDHSRIWIRAEPATLGTPREPGSDAALPKPPADRAVPAVRFTVKDEGIGIRPEDRDQIFTSFFGTFLSLHHSSGSFGFEQRGLGLGLALVKKFAEMHGGYVEFDSEVGVGSEFRVVLPVHGQDRLASGEFAALDPD
jgi:signal transduction histidine kinase